MHLFKYALFMYKRYYLDGEMPKLTILDFFYIKNVWSAHKIYVCIELCAPVCNIMLYVIIKNCMFLWFFHSAEDTQQKRLFPHYNIILLHLFNLYRNWVHNLQKKKIFFHYVAALIVQIIIFSESIIMLCFPHNLQTFHFSFHFNIFIIIITSENGIQCKKTLAFIVCVFFYVFN